MQGQMKWLITGFAALCAFGMFVLIILFMQGRLNSETLDSLFGKDEIAKQETITRPQKVNYSLPSPFSFAEVSRLSDELKKVKREYHEKLKSLEIERKELERFRQDIEERRLEVLKLMQKVSLLYGEIEKSAKKTADGDDTPLTKQQVQNLKKLSKMFEGMQAEQASQRLNKMKPKVIARILLSMSSRSASKILASLNPDIVKDVTQLMQNVK
ncbi:MotE family protein [Candidatus Uabimicrobium amorphum]|uniref:Magnesium transporter MgtE intracellular domain-containing protein n=1 Tax=Uabimicrobium amorphum TaxID=2596890 RepID=A0A5S9F403_UABAM|nr:hypothetical protein [Candidatus Uabimicrobium amorphum]BBM85022.1 hypothetical protein UABAM_03385 [Candidatus Uabimicrobium amorphum]